MYAYQSHSFCNETGRKIGDIAIFIVIMKPTHSTEMRERFVLIAKLKTKIEKHWKHYFDFHTHTSSPSIRWSFLSMPWRMCFVQYFIAVRLFLVWIWVVLGMVSNLLSLHITSEIKSLKLLWCFHSILYYFIYCWRGRMSKKIALPSVIAWIDTQRYNDIYILIDPHHYTCFTQDEKRKAQRQQQRAAKVGNVTTRPEWNEMEIETTNFTQSKLNKTWMIQNWPEIKRSSTQKNHSQVKWNI